MKRILLNKLKIKKKYFLLSLMLIGLIFSVKPALFTYHYILTNYWYTVRGNNAKSDQSAFQAIRFNPRCYLHLPGKNKEIRLLKSSVIYSDVGILKAVGPDRLKQIKKIYNDNFYIQNLFGNLKQAKNWEHLDNLSFEFLRNQFYNVLSKSIVDRLNLNCTKEFLSDLIDFLYWQQNIELGDFIKNKFNLADYKSNSPSSVISYKESFSSIELHLPGKPGIEKYFLGVNQINSADFEKKHLTEQYWTYFNQSNRRPYGEGSFFTNIHTIKKNNTVRIFNLFINNNSESPARGGIYYRDKLHILEGYYLFSFDYWVKNGQEKPHFLLTNTVPEIRLKQTTGEWIKVVFVLNNIEGDIGYIQPVIRIFGVGSVWVDNVFFSKIENSNNLELKTPYLIRYIRLNRGNFK